MPAEGTRVFFGPGSITDAPGRNAWWTRPVLRRMILVLVALIPLLTPLVCPVDDGPFIYSFCAVTLLLSAWFCWRASQLYPSERVRWQTVSLAQCVHAVPYALAAMQHANWLTGNVVQWFANAFIAEAWVLFLPALMGVRAVRGKWVRGLDYLLAGITSVMLMRAMGSGESPGNGLSRVIVVLVAIVFVTAAAFVARASSTQPAKKLFSSVMLLYLGSCLVVGLLLNIVNLYWFARPHILASDLLLCLPEIMLCEAIASWRPPPGSDDADTEPVLVDSLQPSIMAFGGVLAALYGFRLHFLLAASAVAVIVLCYALRTHLFYDRLFKQQKQLRTQATVLENLATRDPLTGIGNRRWFDEEVEKLLAASRSYPCSMLLVDTDSFKDINDSFGHPVGDEVLRALAAVLSEVTAQVKRGCCARLGGDEFGALWPSTDAEQAMVLAESIRQHVESLAFQAPISVTVSLGIATAAEPVSAIKLIRWADGALYQAKAAGRNMVRHVALGKLQEEPLIERRDRDHG